MVEYFGSLLLRHYVLLMTGRRPRDLAWFLIAHATALKAFAIDWLIFFAP